MKTIRIKNEKDIQQLEHTVLVLGYFGRDRIDAEEYQQTKHRRLRLSNRYRKPSVFCLLSSL